MTAREGGKAGSPRSGRALYIAFAAVAVAFVLSTAISEYADVRIQRAASQITGSTAPGVAHLATLRGEIRRYELLADDLVDTGVDGVRRPPSLELERAHAAIDRAWSDYGGIVLAPEERGLASDTAVIEAKLDAAILHLERDIARAAWSEARTTLATEVRPATERLDGILLRLIQRHADRGAFLARRIERLGRESIALAVGLDGVSVLLAIFAALMVVRVVRGYTDLVERRAEELELFAGRVAHDVLGPLGAASLALDVAARDVAPDSRTARLVGSGRAGLRRARTIADALLEFARAGARPTPGASVEVGEIVRAVVDEVEPEAKLRGIVVEVELAEPGAVACGAGILTCVVSNLLRNAVKYVGDGAGKHVRVRAHRSGPWVRLEFEDDGPGLPTALGAQIFQPYVRGPSTGKPGIGLGLATVKKITEAHGGRVDVRSAPGLGCRFGVELPWAPRAAKPAASDGAKLAVPTSDAHEEVALDSTAEIAPDAKAELEEKAGAEETIDRHLQAP
ncbi:MAG TPA: HAMP domain-containing sensor histidine kinase [Polyangia bacterium]|nr:HAMP domain-containing sensor histidine kinase [Polyangia bacterium]